MFVVPAAAAASFKQQVFKQDTGRSEWTRKVGQYVPRISCEEGQQQDKLSPILPTHFKSIKFWMWEYIIHYEEYYLMPCWLNG